MQNKPLSACVCFAPRLRELRRSIKGLVRLFAITPNAEYISLHTSSSMNVFLQFVFVLSLTKIKASVYPKAKDGSPVPCLAPTQWEGRSVEYDHSTGRNTRSAVSYDAKNQRIRILQQNKRHTPCEK